MRKTLVDLIRHGEPVGGKRYRGQVDDPLSEKGWEQMWAAVGDFQGWHRVVTSPLVRCAAFAEALAERNRIPVSSDDRLKEVGFGEWEGWTAAEIAAQDPERVLRFKRNPVEFAPPGAEPLLHFHARVGAAWQELLIRHRGEHVLVVAHAGVIRMIIAHVINLSPEHGYRINIDNAAITRIQVEWSEEAMLATLMFHGGKI